ncbi:Protein of unknown function [Gryllus bimaculatus]|nr:Protein of unknown function [Gryllus bimaculatus]
MACSCSELMARDRFRWTEWEIRVSIRLGQSFLAALSILRAFTQVRELNVNLSECVLNDIHKLEPLD